MKIKEIITGLKPAILMLFGGSILYYFHKMDYQNYLIFVFSPFVFLLIIIHIISPNLLSKKFKLIYISFLIAVLIFTLGNYILSLAYQMGKLSIPVDYREYKFKLDTAPTTDITIYNFKIYLEYPKNAGIISFYTRQNHLMSLKNLRVEIPDGLNITNVNLTSENFIFEEGRHFYLDYSLQEEYRSYVNIENFNISNSFDEVNFLIDFNGNMIPNGKLILDIDVREVWSFDKKTMILNLGPYSCVNPCIGETENSIILPEGYNKLVVLYPKNYYENVPKDSYKPFRQIFGINTINKELQEEAEFKKSIGSGLIVSAFVLFVESIGGCFSLYFTIKEKKLKEETF